MGEPGPAPAVTAFLERHGFPGETVLERGSLRPGRTVVFFHHLGEDYALKRYDAALAEDYRREAGFYRFLRETDIGGVPKLLVAHDEDRILLLSRLAGRRPREGEVDRGTVEQAMAFLVSLQDRENGPGWTASEACASIGDHLAATARQVARAQQGGDGGILPLRMFLEDELEPVWKRVLGSILERTGTAGFAVEAPLDPGALLVSPGHFGFHHALRTPKGGLHFLDFSRSGLDDPARLIGRLFCFGPLPPGPEHWDPVIERLLGVPFLDEEFAVRARILLPAYQVQRACAPLVIHAEGEDSSKIRLSARLLRARKWLTKAHRSL